MDKVEKQEVDINMRAIGILVMAFILGFTSGCANFGNGKLDVPVVTPYEAGWAFVTFDVVAEPFMSDRANAVADSIYALLALNYDQPEALLDEYVRGRIDELYVGASPEFRGAVFNLYLMGKRRVQFQIGQTPNIPSSKVLDEFRRGVNDALTMLKPAPPEDLTAILEAMEP